MERSFITFLLAENFFGIDVQRVVELVPIPEITPIGKLPSFIDGFINVRGKLVLVINMREALGIERTGVSINNYIVIIDVNGLSMGFIVDSIREIISASDEQITKPPKKWVGIDIKYIEGIVRRQGDSITLLDIERIFTDKEKDIVEASARKLRKRKKVVDLPQQKANEVLKKRADELSEKIIEHEEDEGLNVILFRMGDEEYALELKHILQTQKLKYIAKMPSTPEFIAGVMNLGGNIVPVIDLRHLIGQKPEIKKENPALVLDFGLDRIALLVDEIRDIVSIPLKDIKPPLESLSEEKKAYVSGEAVFEEKIIVILNPEVILAQERLAF